MSNFKTQPKIEDLRFESRQQGGCGLELIKAYRVASGKATVPQVFVVMGQEDDKRDVGGKGKGTARIIWTTNVNADSKVDYSTTKGNLDTANEQTTGWQGDDTKYHEVFFNIGAPGSTYYFKVNSKNAAGSVESSIYWFSTSSAKTIDIDIQANVTTSLLNSVSFQSSESNIDAFVRNDTNEINVNVTVTQSTLVIPAGSIDLVNEVVGGSSLIYTSVTTS